MQGLKIVQVGNSLGVVLPKDVLAQLRAGKGDTVYVTAAPDGMRLTPFNPRFAEQMRMAEDVVKRRRNALRALAG
jgi:putative addiction module antidote